MVIATIPPKIGTYGNFYTATFDQIQPLSVTFLVLGGGQQTTSLTMSVFCGSILGPTGDRKKMQAMSVGYILGPTEGWLKLRAVSKLRPEILRPATADNTNRCSGGLHGAASSNTNLARSTGVVTTLGLAA